MKTKYCVDEKTKQLVWSNSDVIPNGFSEITATEYAELAATHSKPKATLDPAEVFFTQVKKRLTSGSESYRLAKAGVSSEEITKVALLESENWQGRSIDEGVLSAMGILIGVDI